MPPRRSRAPPPPPKPPLQITFEPFGYAYDITWTPTMTLGELLEDEGLVADMSLTAATHIYLIQPRADRSSTEWHFEARRTMTLQEITTYYPTYVITLFVSAHVLPGVPRMIEVHVEAADTATLGAPGETTTLELLDSYTVEDFLAAEEVATLLGPGPGPATLYFLHRHPGGAAFAYQPTRRWTLQQFHETGVIWARVLPSRTPALWLPGTAVASIKA